MKKFLHCTLSWLILMTVPLTAIANNPLSPANTDGASPVLVERERVATLAKESFRVLVEGALNPGSQETGAEDAKDEAYSIAADFGNAIDSKLIELEGDGLLTAGEVLDELDAIRDRYEEQLRTVVSAMRAGFSPPPLQQDFNAAWSYNLALGQYTVTTRNSPLNWAYFTLWTLAGLLLAWLANVAATRASDRLSAGDRPSFAHIVSSLGGPLYLSALSLGLRFGLSHLWLPSVVRQTLQGAVDVLLIGALFWLFWNMSPGVARAISGFIHKSYRHDFDGHARNIIVRVLRLLVLTALGIVIVKSVLDTSLSNLLTGLGLIGFALYFILKGTMQNIAASFTIFGDEPFRVGDLVIYRDEWGSIEDIGFRSTRLRTLKGHLITIPNNELVETAVHNAGARPSIRRRFRLGLTYETPPEKVKQAISIIADILEDHDGMPEDQSPKVVFEEFAPDNLQLLIQYNYEPPDFWRALQFDTEVNLQILSRLAEAGIDIAYPTERHILSTTDSQSAPRFELVGGLQGVDHDQKTAE